MRVLFLGTAGGGGLPQWNCNCPYCNKARRESIPRREESCIAISVDSDSWILVDAPPVIGSLIAKYGVFSPSNVRGTSLRSLILTHTDINHMLGMFTFRGPTTHMDAYLTLYSTKTTQTLINDYFKANSIIKVKWYTLELNVWNRLKDMQGKELGLEVFPLSVPGKPPTYHWQEEEGTTVALLIKSNEGKSVLYAPVVRIITEELKRFMDKSDCVIFDGTFWEEEELLKYDPKGKRAKEIGHITVVDSLDILKECKARYKIYTHINNTNPLNDPASREYMRVLSSGVIVAYDGMELFI
ncbi:MBL fold metallo-hydrolase [Hydrogenobacter thermophilus]|uniref:pyrroloquinoline quinone biosynthesis protein PqqB n=1 Tax=Hydrogenobacter thermophilus TaxID=940 RepID=UPI0030FA060A